MFVKQGEGDVLVVPSGWLILETPASDSEVVIVFRRAALLATEAEREGFSFVCDLLEQDGKLTQGSLDMKLAFEAIVRNLPKGSALKKAPADSKDRVA